MMKTFFICSSLFTAFILAVLPTGTIASDRASVTAALGADCRPLPAKLVVPSEMKAARMAGVLSSSWLPCGGGGHVERIGFRIVSPTGAVLAHVAQAYARRDDPPEDDISALELGPGSYLVEISEGGPLTRVVVSFELMGARQPASGILPPGMRSAPKSEPPPSKRKAKGKKAAQ